MSTFTAAKTGFMRVFLAEGPARPDVALEYKLNAIMGAPSKSFGGTEDINIPDPNRYSAFLAVGETSEPDDPWELSMSARVPADARNTLLQLADNRIRISASTEKALEAKRDAHNDNHDAASKRVTIGMLRAVYRRGAGAFSTSHSPRVASRDQWALARVNAFLHLVATGSPRNDRYTGDNDLLPIGHPKATRRRRGR